MNLAYVYLLDKRQLHEKSTHVIHNYLINALSLRFSNAFMIYLWKRRVMKALCIT